MIDRTPGSPIDLLLVDDDPIDRLTWRKALESCGSGLRIAEVDSGDRALEHLQGKGGNGARARPHVCLFDLKLPGASGVDLLDHVRQSRMLRSIPVYIYSSSASDLDVRDCYARGASGYIQKPEDPRRLKLVVSTLYHLWVDVLRYAPAAR